MFRSLLVFLALSVTLSVALPAQADAEARLSAFIAASKTLKANFSQTVIDRNGRKTQTASGDLLLSRPGKFRWQYTQPYSQLLVGDGRKLWIYDEDLQQVTVRTLSRVVSGSPAALLAGDNDIKRLFNLREAGTRSGLDWIEAIAKDKDSGFESVLLGFKGPQLQGMELKDNFGQTTQLHFTQVELNPRVFPGQFHFTPPKGADVIGEP